MICRDVQTLVGSLSLGEATAADRAALAEHAASCPGCREKWQIEECWLAVLARRQPPELSEEALLAARQQLHRALAQEPPRERSWRAELGGIFGSQWRTAHRATLRWSGAWAVILLVIGFGGGWWAHRLAPRAGTGASGAATTAQVRVQAIEPDGAGQVKVVYETVRRQSVIGAAQDPQLRHLLLLAAGQPANAGMQLESIAALRPAAGEDAVRQTLLAALAGDPNPGVRLEALNALRPLVSGDAAVRAALAQVVLRDPNPGLRMQAVAALAQAPRAVAHRWLRQLSVQSPDPYIRLNCVAAMRQLDITPPAAALAPLSGEAGMTPATGAAPAPTRQ